MSPNPTEDKALLELQTQMVGKDKAERAKMLLAFAKEHYGIAPESPAPVVELSDDQFQRLFSGCMDEAKKVAKEAAGQVERAHGLNPGHAMDLATDEVGKAIVRQMHRQADLEQCAMTLRSLCRAATGRAQSGELASAYEAEKDYIRKSGRQSRAMSIGTDTTGGYTGGELFDTMLYDNVARVSQARKYCTLVNMTKEIYRLPKLTTSLTAEQLSEAGTATPSQWVLDQFVLNTKKIQVLSKPFSVELMEVADPALVQTLLQFMTIEIAKLEDSKVFSTSAPGILSHSANVVTLGAGKTAITDVDFDDMHDMINELDEQYMPDEDIKGSGLIGGEARFWVPRSLINTLAKSKGNDNYHWANVQDLKMNKRVHGFEAKRVVSMTQAPAAAAKAFCFGNLAYMWCGVRPGYRIELQSQGTVDSVNLNETNSYALRVTEFFDNDSIDDEAFSVCKLATT